VSVPATVAMSPRELLDAAQELLTKSIEGTAGLWPRAAAVLIRQALEDQMTIILTKSVPGAHESSARTKLICLQSELDDVTLAEEVAHAWWALTAACHRRTYDLAPTADELQRWLETGRQISNYAIS
jgi:hypothetical protein